MRIDYILKAAAKRMVGVTVDCDSAYSTVCISMHGEDDIFMQGDDAEQFISECEAMSNRCQCLNFDIIELALAEPYTESFWS
jgi:hypothetical protein